MATVIDEAAALQMVSTLEQTPIAHTWLAYGTSINLEFGHLTQKDGRQPSGANHVNIEFSWRLEDAERIVLGSWSETDVIDKVSSILTGATIQDVSFFGRLPEMRIDFTNGLSLVSFSTVEGDPQWTVRIGSRYLGVDRGEFTVENGT